MQTDVVHCHGLWQDSQRVALHWQKRTGKSVVISPHGMLDPWALRNSAWKKKLVGKLFADASLHKATCLHALCQAEVDSIRAYGLKNPIAVIPNGVALPNLIGEHSLQEKQTNTGRKRLLFLGRIHPKKGLLELLQAWKLILTRRAKAAQSWQLIIAGWDDGGHLQKLQKQAEELGIARKEMSLQSHLLCKADLAEDASVIFCGPVFGKDKDTLFRSVDAFILPSYSEGLPMAILEAWSYGLPVLMTSFCNIPDGFVVNAAIQIEPETGSIIGGLEQLIAMPVSDLWSIGLKGRQLVEQKFQWGTIARDMKEVYEWMSNNCLQPTCMIIEK
jgi:poly(glycerol-phosphate) alpha-glucosyltransferase